MILVRPTKYQPNNTYNLTVYENKTGTGNNNKHTQIKKRPNQQVLVHLLIVIVLIPANLSGTSSPAELLNITDG